jgi:flagellar motor switch protein FliM
MKTMLSQEQIRSLIRKAGSAASSAAPEGRTVVPFDVRQSGQLSPSQVQALSKLHEPVARKIAGSLNSLLGVACEVQFASIEQVAYAEFHARFQGPTYISLLYSPAADARLTVQMDLAVVLPILDLILGGTGKAGGDVRALTEIEMEMFEPVLRIVYEDVRLSWLPLLDLGAKFESRAQSQEASAASASEKAVAVKFELKLAEAQGHLHLLLPGALSAALVRKLTAQLAPADSKTSQQCRARLQSHLLQGEFEVELQLPPSTVSVRDLIALEPGGVLVLHSRTADAIVLNVVGETMFLASAVRSGSQCGARIEKVLSIASQSRKVEP